MHALLVVYNALPSMLAGSLVTMGNVAVSLGMGLALGVPLAVGQVYGGPWLRRLAALYVWFFRGVPILVLLFLCYGLFMSLGLPVDPFIACCLVLGCTSTAYQSQIFRGAMESLPRGQLNAALALGMGERTGICCIVLPQALRLSIPGWANEFSILLKDSAICYVLGTQDIMARTSFAAARTHEHLALYAAAGALYCLLTLVVLRFLRRLEEKVQVPGYAAGSGLDGMEMG
ncbi:amino acid ABC transporter permease [Desulfovibrio legallii]|uniref:Amino acid ABC transporter membrane protein 1, PAAT family n=1 Tax=Desulfovibrio legallii TaxID=571438 RepID=A0A1G7MQ68_9BACT|nr:amino acid ABC transporter permease [Desulfovibrio legallii]SDF63269.1 amino acid ABC transporter membrane protein 1, PAAT family [Desulfovibrio legallii]